MSISIESVCDDWVNDNPEFEAGWEYNMVEDNYELSVRGRENVLVSEGIGDVRAKALIPANRVSIGSGVVLLTLDALKNQALLFRDYGVIL